MTLALLTEGVDDAADEACTRKRPIPSPSTAKRSNTCGSFVACYVRSEPRSPSVSVSAGSVAVNLDMRDRMGQKPADRRAGVGSCWIRSGRT